MSYTYVCVVEKGGTVPSERIRRVEVVFFINFRFCFFIKTGLIYRNDLKKKSIFAGKVTVFLWTIRLDDTYLVIDETRNIFENYYYYNYCFDVVVSKLSYSRTFRSLRVLCFSVGARIV